MTQYTDTEILTASNNFLKNLKGIHKFTNLRELIVRKNQIKKLTKRVWDLESLRVINLSGNQLKTIPKSNGETRLRYLNLSNNRITKLPQGLDKLSLEMIDLSNNQLTELPEMYSFDGVINLSGNKFVKFIAKDKGHLIKFYTLVNPNQVCLGGANGNLKPVSDYVNSDNIQNYVNACEKALFKANKELVNKFTKQ